MMPLLYPYCHYLQYYATLVFILLLFPLPIAITVKPGSLEPVDLLYNNGIQAYFQNDWESAIEYLEKALHNYDKVRKVKQDCRSKCEGETQFHLNVTDGFFQDLSFFDTILKKADCLKFCETLLLGPISLHRLSREVENDFQERVPYNYLQLALFKTERLTKAIAAAHTFFVLNPDDEDMKRNIKNYRIMPGVKASDFQDLEAASHWVLYNAGVSLYEVEKYEEAIQQLEMSLLEFLSEYEKCRALCDGPYESEESEESKGEESSQDLYEVIADHYVQILTCRQNCIQTVSTESGKSSPTEGFLPSYFNYLQFSYYMAKKYDKAAECAKTYLVFFPSDETMQQNLQSYEALLGQEMTASIPPRENLRSVVEQSLMEKKMLHFAADSLGIPFTEQDLWSSRGTAPQSTKVKQRVEKSRLMSSVAPKENAFGKKDDNPWGDKQEDGDNLPFPGVTVTFDSAALKGSQRVVMDGVLSDSECTQLLELATTGGGEGHQGRRSPHTPNERFSAITVLKALKLALQQAVAWDGALVYHTVTEKVRLLVESYFNTQNPLYFSFTQLICRTAAEGKQENRSDLSHAVHADNCILDPEEKKCWREPPAYVFRDYSAFLYLNDNYEGGDFFFTDLDAKTVTAEVRPKCGRLVAFSSGGENPHGVQAVTSGQRCAIAMWFTHSEQNQEQERLEADELIEKSKTSQESSEMGDVKEDAASKKTAGQGRRWSGNAKNKIPKAVSVDTPKEKDEL
ncbi:prolyl 3-hydroxylase 3 [Protopterus annectens]|uniref:prolyl 3-hydroxylase 3 n=1 Tax=Protopterus annectens TaxID=7888 RepID=UPI001CFA15D1|nr:prolyl 3-hydroxylase 3 [Protopterus annectens]